MALCRIAFAGAALLCGLSGCATPATPEAPLKPVPAETLALLERVTWGVNAASLRQVQVVGWDAYLAAQLDPGPVRLPASVQAQIDAMSISQHPLAELVQESEQRRKEITASSDAEAKKVARQAYDQELNRLGREAASRALLLALYAPNQLQQQMTWFWMNHFSVFQGKRNLRAMVGDYEAHAIAPHALGKFRDLLGATAHHPAMLLYLDNVANASNRSNENYARELMELHTLGLNGGYSQRDVQELARILSGVGVNLSTNTARLATQLQGQYVRQGLFEFNPQRHDFGNKQFLGATVRGRGLSELDEALDRLSRSPATARFISHKLAVFFVADTPPEALVERMTQTFLRSDGDIAATLQTLFTSAELRQSLGHQFKDPLHYVLSSLRLAYDEKVIVNTDPIMSWLKRMGEPLYGRATPDGYALTESAWASPGQMTIRFDIAETMGSGYAGLFKGTPATPERAAFPQLANALYFQTLQARLGSATLQALDAAVSPQEWNAFLLSSPEMMHR